MIQRDTYYALVDVKGDVALPVTFGRSYPGSEKCVVIWQKSYDAMRNELEELRKELKEIKEWGERHGMRINGGV